MQGREGTQVFSPEDLDLLQSCFDHILLRRSLHRTSAEADAVAQALILAYQRGVTDYDDLLKLADIARDRAA